MRVARLQTAVTREIHPIQPAVVAVGAIQDGATYNIIPDSCLIKGTVRALHAEAGDAAEAAIKRLAEGMLAGMRIRCDVACQRGVRCLVNDDRINPFEASLEEEDFALMAEHVPSFQLKVGSRQPGRQDSLRNSAYQPDEACIGCGVQALSRAALELLAG
jgi:metal-dependent amidase/aminoacylase/carboxypeptidase family protein